MIRYVYLPTERTRDEISLELPHNFAVVEHNMFFCYAIIAGCDFKGSTVDNFIKNSSNAVEMYMVTAYVSAGGKDRIIPRADDVLKGGQE